LIGERRFLKNELDIGIQKKKLKTATKRIGAGCKEILGW
jgi:hypothetical protein